MTITKPAFTHTTERMNAVAGRGSAIAIVRQAINAFQNGEQIMENASKGQASDKVLLLALVVVGLVIILGVGIFLVAVVGKPAGLNAVPMIGDALCQLMKGLRIKC